MNACKRRELAGNNATASMTTWYMLNNLGDDILFVGDDEERDKKYINYIDKTDEVLECLIEEEILKDYGFIYKDEDEPESVYIRDIRNIWDRDK